MTFEIGDEEFTEVNTSYDQNQPIGDEPNALNTELSNSEPIDAKTGQDFLSIDVGEALICNCGDKFDNEHDADIHREEMGDFQGEWDHKIIGNEKLNKDGTGTASARRGIDPTNPKHGVMKFDYVSKAGCEICKKYDGKTFGWDSPNRPVIPRLEEGDGKRPYTHPNCKCRWTKVFNEVQHNNTMKANEIAPDLLKRANAWYGDGFEDLKQIEKQLVVIDMLKTSLGMEKKAEEFDVIDPVPLASMAVLAFNAIKPNVKQKLGLEYAGQPKAQPHNFGIQSVLDNLVGKGLHETKKKEIEEEVNKDFTLDNLLVLTAKALADKLGKTLGVESKANEMYDEDENYGDPDDWRLNKTNTQCPKCKQQTLEQMSSSRDCRNYECDYTDNYSGDDAGNDRPKPTYNGKVVESDHKHKLVPIASKPVDYGGFDGTYNYGENTYKCTICGYTETEIEEFGYEDRELSNEGGKGSGKKGHEPWFLGAEVGDPCENCMVITEKDNGKCMICGN